MRYLLRMPKKTAGCLALAGLGTAFAAGAMYLDYNSRLNDELRYARANVMRVPNISGAGWHNFENEGGGTADDWALHMHKLKALNGGKDITALGPNEHILLFDLPDYKTGKPDGTVLPAKKE